jgi:uncharacterized membrane protein HdeD (DUF308 family)
MTDQVSRADLADALGEIRQQVAAHWGWFLALGLVLILAGCAAIAFPLLSTIAVKIALGWVFLVGGVLMVVHAFSASRWRGLIWEVLLGLLYLVAGAYLAFFPLTVEGALEVVLALRVRPHEGWGWLLLSGLIAAAVGLLIALGLPSSAAWAIGLLAGINLISTGWGFLFLALAGRRANTAVAAR